MSNKNINQTPCSSLMGSLLLASILWLVSTCSFAEEPAHITIRTAAFSLQEQTILLHADIQYALSNEAIEALHNGVTLTFIVDLSINEPRNWLWDKSLSSISLPYQIKHRTLAETYQISDITNSIQHNFSSLRAALRALGSLKEIPLFAIAIPSESSANASITAYLQIESLPLPMRPVAYITPGWYLRSDAFQWSLNP